MIFLSLFLSFALADDFSCSNDGTQIVGNVIKACGVGEHKSLDMARKLAYLSAHKEALWFYRMSDRFNGRLVDEVPARQVCFEHKNHWICHRLINVTVHTDQPVAKN